MNFVKFLLFPLLLLTPMACGSEDGYRGVNIDEAIDLLQKKDSNMVILDVRTSDEFEIGNVENSINLDVSKDDFAEKAKNLDKDKAYFIYCKSGARASKASKIMLDLRFNSIIVLKNAGYLQLSEKL